MDNQQPATSDAKIARIRALRIGYPVLDHRSIDEIVYDPANEGLAPVPVAGEEE